MDKICRKQGYLPPEMEVTEFMVEQGFAQSGPQDIPSGGGFGDF